jgi:Replication-relaxation
VSRPVDRPGTLSAPASNSGAGAGYLRISTPKGSVFSQSLYLTADRLYQISREMSERDLVVLRFVHDSRFATGAQLIRGFWLTGDPESNAARAGRRTLKRLADWRVLERLPRRIGGRRTGSDGFVYRVGRAGVRLLAARGIHGPRVEAPGTLHLVHTLATTELALRLREADRDGTLECIEVQQEPACWRRFPGPMGAHRVLKPDLFVRIGAGGEGAGEALEDRWLAEIDLASEAGRTIAGKAGVYLEHYRSGREQHDHGTYPRVLWLAPDEHRARQIGQVLRRQPAEARRLFTVCLFEDAIQLLAAEARS